MFLFSGHKPDELVFIQWHSHKTHISSDSVFPLDGGIGCCPVMSALDDQDWDGQVCVHVCVSACVCVRAHACECMSRPEMNLVLSSGAPTLCFNTRSLTETWSLLVRHSWSSLARDPQGSSCLHSPSAGIADPCHCAWLFTWLLEIELRSSCLLALRDFTDWVLPQLRIFFFFFFF